MGLVFLQLKGARCVICPAICVKATGKAVSFFYCFAGRSSSGVQQTHAAVPFPRSCPSSVAGSRGLAMSFLSSNAGWSCLPSPWLNAPPSAFRPLVLVVWRFADGSYLTSRNVYRPRLPSGLDPRFRSVLMWPITMPRFASNHPSINARLPIIPPS